MRFAALNVASTVLLAGVSFAQNFNIDIGGGTTGTPLPSAAFLGAAGQPGTWNALDPNVGGIPILLSDVGGTPTAVTFARTAGTGGQFNSNNAGTSGDDEALMDDCDFPPGTGSTWTISGLAAGTYDVYTYAWAPDSAAYQSKVSVNGGAPTCVGGAWTGVYTLGVTHALDTVAVGAGGSIAIAFVSPVCVTFHTFNGVQVKLSSTPTAVVCPGDTAALCPCSGAGGTGTPNPGATGNGCANSGFPAGAKLTATGNAVDNANDTLVLTCSNMTGPGLFIQSNGLVGPVINFNDGTLCAASGIIRMGVVFPTAGVASYPGGLTPNPIHVAGAPVLLNGTPTPETKYYQCWYRDITVGFCNVAGHNMSNGISLVWAP